MFVFKSYKGYKKAERINYSYVYACMFQKDKPWRSLRYAEHG